MNPFVERHRDKISGLLSCFDRVVITGTLPDIGYAGAMAGYLSYHKIRLFDYPRWAEPLRDELRNHAEQLARESGIEIEFIRRHKAFRKEDRIKAIIRGNHPGLVHIFSAMESCTAYRPWHDKKKGGLSGSRKGYKQLNGHRFICTFDSANIFKRQRKQNLWPQARLSENY